MTNTNTIKVTGYTLNEMFDFGFYDWTLIASEPTSIPDDWKGCEYYEDCPCCNCGNTVVVVETFARPRWSKSGKRMVDDTTTVWSCAGHASK
jgi:hypothetical protein